MRTYILALTKYALTAVVVGYTILSYILLISRKKNVHGVLAYMQSVLMLIFQLIAYVTLSVAMNDPTYIFFSIVQLVTFFIATALFRNLYRKAYLPLFNNMCFLLSIGLVIISRLSFSSAWRQFVIAVGGLALAIILPLFRKYFHLLKLPKFYWGLAGIVILSVVMLLGSSTLGANITWTIGGLTFQPSEFVKILYMLFLACTLKDVKTLKDILIVAVFAGAHVLVLVGSNDLGSGLIYYVVFFFMLYLATDSILFLLGGTGMLAVGSVVLYHFFSHVQLRVAAFLDPWSYIDSIGYQITQALFAIGAGGAFGSGLGQGTPDKIPFATTDFIFASCCEEYGLIIGVCIILISLNCFFVMLKLAMGFADKFYQLLSYGIAVAYGFQAFLTIGGQTKFIPLTGVTLPLISYGGSSILTTMIMFTLVEIMYILRSEKIDEYRRQQQRYQQAAYRSTPPVGQGGYRYPQSRYQNPGHARNYTSGSRRYQ